MRVLAIDPSLRNTGVAIIETNGHDKLHAHYFGVIHNPAALPMSSFLVAIRDRLAEPCPRTRLLRASNRSSTSRVTKPRSRSAPPRLRSWPRPTGSRFRHLKTNQTSNGREWIGRQTQVAFMVRALLGRSDSRSMLLDALAIGLTHCRPGKRAPRPNDGTRI